MGEDLEAELKRRFDSGDLVGTVAAAITGYGDELFGFLVGLARDVTHADDVFGRRASGCGKGCRSFAGTARSACGRTRSPATSSCTRRARPRGRGARVSGHGMGWMGLLPEQPNDPPGVALLANAPGPSWRIVVGLFENGSTSSNGSYRGGATAVCVDIPNAAALDFNRVSTGGSTTLPIPTSVVADYTCGLRQISGGVDHPIEERGIELFHNGTPDWLLSLRTGYTTTAHCVR